jgi:hypothetical protein
MSALAEEIRNPAPSAVLEGSGNAAADAAVSQAAQTVAKARRRGRPTKSADTPPSADKRGVAQAQAEMQKALEELYKPEHWHGICKAPADLMLALSGDSMWDLPKAEVDVLASQSSLAARYFMATDPKWVALALFAFSVATTYGTRTMLHIKKRRDELE